MPFKCQNAVSNHSLPLTSNDYKFIIMKFAALLSLAGMAQAITIGVFENQKNGGGQFKAFDTPHATCSKFSQASHLNFDSLLTQFWQETFWETTLSGMTALATSRFLPTCGASSGSELNIISMTRKSLTCLSDANCKGASLVVPASSGGVDANIPANHNDKITSFACYNK
jgi:hypothetical protein